MPALVACFFTSNPRTFNPAEYSESMSTDGCGTKLVVWETTQNGTDEGPGKCFVFVRSLWFVSCLFLRNGLTVAQVGL